MMERVLVPGHGVLLLQLTGSDHRIQQRRLVPTAQGGQELRASAGPLVEWAFEAECESELCKCVRGSEGGTSEAAGSIVCEKVK